ncbi:MAG: acetyl-CoA carboxylase biotin carboxyl carrier protein subunit [Comamonadaceae bacterium]|nr:acetyl-CoA carboxylase biotin carboxyl carrier protein subunit [Comamonadaceae bacterium]
MRWRNSAARWCWSTSTVGQAVKQGDRLLLLEAMKMKTPVIASRSGQVDARAGEGRRRGGGRPGR